MMDEWPLRMFWDGNVMRPISGWLSICQDRLTTGEHYMVSAQAERSHRSHNHYFASLKEAWVNLPEGMADQFPTPTHLRKFALIKTGYHDRETYVMTSPGDALRLAAALRRQRDDFAIVTVTGCAVTRYVAKSQNQVEMGAKEFQASKQAVIEYLATLIDVSADQLKAEAGQSA